MAAASSEAGTTCSPAATAVRLPSWYCLRQRNNWLAATPCFQPHLQLLIPVDVVNFVTPVKTAGVNWRREQATRQKFYVNKPGYGSTSGGRKIQAIASALSRVDAVSGADDNYEQSRYA